MKYEPPYGVSDPDASYVDGVPAIGQKGSIPPAASFEHPMRELVALIENNQLVPTEADLEQVAKGVRSQRMNYVEDTGSVNTLSVAFDPPLQVYTVGLPMRVKVRNTNSGPATIDAGAGRVAIRRPTGSEVAAGDLPAGGLVGLVYDGTNFEMINFGGGAVAGAPEIYLTNIPYCVDSSIVKNTVTANFSPAITAYTQGLIFMVKIANTNNSFSNINVNGLGNKPIYAQGGHPNWPLLPGDLQVGDVLVFIYDGSSFWIYPNSAITENVTFNVSSPLQYAQLFSALSRKRISTTGTVTITLAAGIYSSATANSVIMASYHADATRITVVGTMQTGQSPPNPVDFQKTGTSSAALTNDAQANLTMLRGRYATEVQLGTSVQVGFAHTGPGVINLQNILVTGPKTLVAGQRGFSVSGGYLMRCVHCSAWGIGDMGYACDSGGNIQAEECHASACVTDGFLSTSGARMSLTGGGAYGGAGNGVEVSYGAMVGTNQFTGGTSFTASYNAQYGIYAKSGISFALYATLVSNGAVDYYAWVMGIGVQHYSTVYSTSPAVGSVGNYNSVMISYG
jgi:hypothetical protein